MDMESSSNRDDTLNFTTSLHERTKEGDTATSSHVDELPARISNSLSLNAKEFVPTKILSKGISQTTSTSNNNTQSVGSPSFITNNNNTQTAHAAVVEVDGVMIDSALVAALRDPRERMALFKLEMALVEFITECQSKNPTADEGIYDYVDVGGQGFSLILGGGSTSLPSSTRGNPSDLTNNSSTALRQTSFQRLVMHRLADRFGIIREPSPLSTIQVPLIRLVRVSSSFIPSPLLIDLDLSKLTKVAYTNYVQSIPQDRGNEVDEEITLELSATTIGNVGGGEEATDTLSRPSNQKVMIMKRSTSSTSSKRFDSDNNLVGLDGYDATGSSHKLKGKKVSDKEKAYAEARARIFNLSANDSLVQDLDNPTMTESEFSNFTDSSLFQALQATVPTPSGSGTETPQSQGGDLVSSTPTPPVSSSSLVESDSNTTNNQGIDGVAASKVLWRNRKQEESDPDFRRGVIPVVASTTMSSNAYPVPVSFGLPSNNMRGGRVIQGSVLTTNPVPPSSDYYYPVMYPNLGSSSYAVHGGGTTPNNNTQNMIRLQRGHEMMRDLPLPDSSLPCEVIVRSSDIHLAVPSLETSTKEDLSNPRGKMNVSPVGKVFTINRPSGSSPWGMDTSAKLKPTKDDTGTILSYNDSDFPALG